MKKFSEIEYTAGVKSLMATDEFLLRVWDIFAQKEHGNSNIDIIRALLKIEHKTLVRGISANTAFALEWDVKPPCVGADMYPDQYQEWEKEGHNLCVREIDFSFSLTGYGAIVKDRLMREIKKHYNLELLNINSNKYKHPLEL